MHRVFRLALHEETASLGMANGPPPNDAALRQNFTHYQSLSTHLTRTADQFWVAEQGREIAGFARSILRSGVRQLTEFFVLPGQQEHGLGKKLLDLTFPTGGAANRVIVASPDVRAIYRYLQAGVRSYFTIYEWFRKPEIVSFETDLAIEPISPQPETLAELNAIDQVVLGYTREIDHRWLLQERLGFLYRRNGKAAGYSYLRNRLGPVALLDQSDYPAVLAHLESEMTRHVDDAYDDFYLPVPMTNHAALEYVLKRGCRTSPFLMHFMSDRPLGNYANYIFMDPPIFS